MASLNISLPDQMKSFIESRVETGDYGTPSEYVRHLIRQDKEALAVMENRLLKSIEGGGFPLSDAELNEDSFIETLRRKLAERGKKI